MGKGRVSGSKFNYPFLRWMAPDRGTGIHYAKIALLLGEDNWTSLVATREGQFCKNKCPKPAKALSCSDTAPPSLPSQGFNFLPQFFIFPERRPSDLSGDALG